MRARDAWRRLPEPAQWALAYAATLAASVSIGLATPLGPGNAIFLAGALAIVASTTKIRLGGPRQRIVGRTLKGAPKKGPMPADERRAEIRQGVLLFVFGLALWTALGILAIAGKTS